MAKEVKDITQSLPPSRWVTRFLMLAHPGGRGLDVACGVGRHLQAGIAAGLMMTGIDRDLRSAHAVPALGNARLIEADLEDGAPFPTGGQRFDVVIVTNYLWRPILSDVVAAVADDGLLIYETFADGNERYGRPANPDHLLRPGELLDVVRNQLAVLAYEQVDLLSPYRKVQRICAVGPSARPNLSMVVN